MSRSSMREQRSISHGRTSGGPDSVLKRPLRSHMAPKRVAPHAEYNTARRDLILLCLCICGVLFAIWALVKQDLSSRPSRLVRATHALQ